MVTGQDQEANSGDERRVTVRPSSPRYARCRLRLGGWRPAALKVDKVEDTRVGGDAAKGTRDERTSQNGERGLAERWVMGRSWMIDEQLKMSILAQNQSGPDQPPLPLLTFFPCAEEGGTEGKFGGALFSRWHWHWH